MERKPSPHLKKVLKSYQLTAANTLSGPNSLLARLDSKTTANSNNNEGGDPTSPSPSPSSTSSSSSASEAENGTRIIVNVKKELDDQVPTIVVRNNRLCNGLILSPPALAFSLPPPILSTPDRVRTEKTETVLEGKLISCFVVGGEKRLCFPQILTMVLHPFSLPQINQMCEELRIFCSRCSEEQLEVLKMAGVIPMNANSCGLIRTTDAERLVNSLLHRNPPKAAVVPFSRERKEANFRVYHECFGKCKGLVLPHLYSKPDALCIECVECQGLFSPPRFVAHSHRPLENRTCHWGFDSANWRHYLIACRDGGCNSKLLDKSDVALAEFKAKFDHKRKDEWSDGKESMNGAKKIRILSEYDNFHSLPTKKRFIQKADDDQKMVVSQWETESVKKLLSSRLERDEAACVSRLIDKMAAKISSLEEICRNQEKVLRDVSEKPGVELQAKVNTMEAELHSLKKCILRRHEQRSSDPNVN